MPKKKVVPYVNGKNKCDYLKRIRERIAQYHNIEGFEYKPCPTGGKGCRTGTCEACDKDVSELQEKLDEMGIDLFVPNDPDMPKELIGVMSNEVFSDMKSLCDPNNYASRSISTFNYDADGNNRILTKKSKDEYDNDFDQNEFVATGYYPPFVGRVSPHRYVDYNTLEQNAKKRAIARAKTRKTDGQAFRRKLKGLMQRKRGS